MAGSDAHLSATGGTTAIERSRLAAIARRFYLEDASKIELAAEFGLSRFKIARMLEQARELGIVTITIRDSPDVDWMMSTRLARHLGLSEAVVTSAAGDDPAVRAGIGQAAADLLSETLHPGDVLGLAWGRTLTAMSAALHQLPHVSVVQLTGAVGTDLSESPVEIVRRASLAAGGHAYPIFAPMLVADSATADALRSQPEVRQAISLFSGLTAAVVAVGSWDPLDSQLAQVTDAATRDDLLRRGVRAEITGILFDDDGAVVAPEYTARCLSINAEQLYAVPRVIAAAGGRSKALAVRAVARSGLITGLVTNRELAVELLRQPGVTRPMHTRRIPSQ